MEVVRESEKLLQLPRICRFGKSRDPIQLGTGEMASVLTDSVPEILNLSLTNPAPRDSCEETHPRSDRRQ